MYCFNCNKTTETTNERKEEREEWYILKGICKVCNETKYKKIGKNKKYNNLKLLS